MPNGILSPNNFSKIKITRNTIPAITAPISKDFKTTTNKANNKAKIK